jgi:hypothetical protein
MNTSKRNSAASAHKSAAWAKSSARSNSKYAAGQAS